MSVDPPSQRGPGRPRKWSSEAERMRAYRARRREVTADLDAAWREVRRLESALERSQKEAEHLRARVRELTSENGELRAAGRERRRRAVEVEERFELRPAPEQRPFSLSRAERRRRERLGRKRPDEYG